jgi:hypothetical protein
MYRIRNPFEALIGFEGRPWLGLKIHEELKEDSFPQQNEGLNFTNHYHKYIIIKNNTSNSQDETIKTMAWQ